MVTDSLFQPAMAFTLDQGVVASWLEEKQNIENQINALSIMKAALDAKLDAAKLLAPGLFPHDQDEAGGSQRTVLDSIADLLSTIDEGLTPREIRARLQDDQRVANASSNYLYTALGRGVERGVLIKDGEKYSVPQPHLTGLGSEGA